MFLHQSEDELDKLKIKCENLVKIVPQATLTALNVPVITKIVLEQVPLSIESINVEPLMTQEDLFCLGFQPNSPKSYDRISLKEVLIGKMLTCSVVSEFHMKNVESLLNSFFGATTTKPTVFYLNFLEQLICEVPHPNVLEKCALYIFTKFFNPQQLAVDLESKIMMKKIVMKYFGLLPVKKELIAKIKEYKNEDFHFFAMIDEFNLNFENFHWNNFDEKPTKDKINAFFHSSFAKWFNDIPFGLNKLCFELFSLENLIEKEILEKDISQWGSKMKELVQLVHFDTISSFKNVLQKCGEKLFNHFFESKTTKENEFGVLGLLLTVNDFLISDDAQLEPRKEYDDILLGAAKIGNLPLGSFIIEKGAHKNVIGKDGWTPLHYAAVKGHLEIVKILVEKGANKDAVDKDGFTPLHYAVKNGHLEIVKIFQ